MLSLKRGALLRDRGHNSVCMPGAWVWKTERCCSGCLSVNLATPCGTLNLFYKEYFFLSVFLYILSLHLCLLFPQSSLLFLLKAEPFPDGGQGCHSFRMPLINYIQLVISFVIYLFLFWPLVCFFFTSSPLPFLQLLFSASSPSSLHSPRWVVTSDVGPRN